MCSLLKPLAVALLTLCACAALADEFRGVWVDAWGAGLQNQAQIDKLLGVPGNANSKGDIRNANLNAVVVQVRRRADVCYPSGMGEPYFSGLSPAQFNALQAIIDAAHDTTGGKQRIEVHAWVVAFATGTSASSGPVYLAHSDPSDPDNYWITLTATGGITDDKALDPGHPRCLEYLTNVCMDLVNNFDIDGIHYDYIRFTANNQGYNPTSVARFNQRYGRSGQPAYNDTQFQQWRRDQVSALVRQVYARIQASKPWVKQSAAAVTWNPSPATSTRAAFHSTRPYYDVYSDWDSWMQEGILDMAIPMTYYNQGGPYVNDYYRWIEFEKDRKFSRHMIVGPGGYLSAIGGCIEQLLMTRTASVAGNYCQGFCIYSYRIPYSSGTWAGFVPTLLSQVTSQPADIPEMPWKTNPANGHISGTVTYAPGGTWADGVMVSVTGPVSRSMHCDGTGFYAFIDLPPGSYTVMARQTGYPDAVRNVNLQIGVVTGNMYVTDLVLGGSGAPAVINVQASNINQDSATISWTTDQASTSQVEFGLTTSYGSMTALDGTQVTSHAMNLTGLAPNTLYHYRVMSSNANGTSTSGDYTFSTGGPPTISNVQATEITATTATISWTTASPADAVVNYGTTPAYGLQASNPVIGVEHSVSLSGLTPETTYNYRCLSTNAFGSGSTGNKTFTTGAFSGEMVIDNTDAGWSNTSPNSNTWTAGSVAEVPKIGSNYLYRHGDGSTVESSITGKCRWTPNLPFAGNYDVYVYYQIGSNRNPSAPYTVYYDGGQLTSIQNQYSTSINQGGWFLIGENLPFAAGTAGYVELTTLSTSTNYISADAAKWVYRPDVTAPSIESVSVSPSMAALGDSLAVAVLATDSIGVSSVTVNGQPLIHVSGNLWTGTLTSAGVTSPDLVTTHPVTVVAQDAAGNASADNSGSYVAFRVVALDGNGLLHQICSSASSHFLFKTWGRVQWVDDDYFDLTDGWAGAVRVHCANHGLQTNDLAVARGFWNTEGMVPTLECQNGHAVKVQ